MRAVTTNIQTQLSAKTALPRVIAQIYLDGGTVYLTNHTSSLTFQGITYIPWRFEISGFTTTLPKLGEGMSVNNGSVSFDNADNAFNAYLGNAPFSGRMIQLFWIFLNSSTLLPIDGSPNTNDSLGIVLGQMNAAKINESSYTIDIPITNIFDRSTSFGPWRIYGPLCNNNFCDVQCQDNGSVAPSGTASAGSTTTLTSMALVGTASMVGAIVIYDSGINLNLLSYVSAHNTMTGQITWTIPLKYPINPGDAFHLDCDKNESSCITLGNDPNFGGFNQMLHYEGGGGFPAANQVWAATMFNMLYLGQTMNVIPLVYGEGMVDGNLIFCGLHDRTIYGDINPTEDVLFTLYSFCTGEIDSVQALLMGGTTVIYPYMVTTTGVYPYYALNGFLESPPVIFTGTATQTIDLPLGETAYYHNVACAFMTFYADTTPGSGPTFTGLSLDWSNPKISAIVRGRKVQKYNSDGSANGLPAWSQNPIWCLLDYLMVQASQVMASSLFNWPQIVTAAAACDANGVTCNLVLKGQTKDTDILNYFLLAASAYPTFEGNQLGFVVQGPGPPVFSFDDSSNGGMNDNIVQPTFDGPWEDNIDDCYNRVVVTYTDSQTRQYCALLNGDLPANATTIPFISPNWTTASSVYYASTPFPPVIYINGEAITYTGITGTLSDNLYIDLAFTGCSYRVNSYPNGYPLYAGPQTFPQLTAVYQDNKNILKVGRVNEKDLNATSVPNYSQAYQLARTLVHLYIDGDHYCSFNGMRDSYALECGDIVAITSDRPGWVNQKFRIIQINEQPFDKVQRAFTFKYHDDSWYEAVGMIPPSNLSTVLPDPFAPLSVAANLALGESAGALFNGVYQPLLTLSYSVPTGNFSAFWGPAHIYCQSAGASSWTSLGYDNTNGAGFNITSGFVLNQAFTVKVVNVNSLTGKEGDFNSAPTVSITPMNAFVAGITNLYANVVDNNVLLYWTGVPGRFPIISYEVRTGNAYAGSTLIGYTSSTFDTYFETVGGTYKYWVTPIDANGIYGTSDSITATVSQPPQFILHSNFNDYFSGTLSNIYFDPMDDQFFACMDTTSTWNTWCTANSISTFQDIINLGGYWIEPMLTMATYTQTFDAGAVLSSSCTVKATLDSVVFLGSVTVTPTISTSPDKSTWTTFSGVWQTASSGFRYVKIQLAFAGSAAAIIALNNLNVTLSAKQISDYGNGTVTNAATGVVVDFNQTFAGVSSITVTPQGTTAVYATYDFTFSANPTSFTVFLFNSSGTAITGNFSWAASGI